MRWPGLPRVDWRFGLGLCLVVLSGLGVWLSVNSSPPVSTVYVASKDLASGQLVDHTVVREHQLVGTGLPAGYLRPGDLNGERYLERPVGLGEMIPSSALGSTPPGGQLYALAITGSLPEGVGAGSRVDVWARPSERGRYGTVIPRGPVPVASTVEVLGVTTHEGYSVELRHTLQVRLTESQLVDILAALGDGQVLAVVKVISR